MPPFRLLITDHPWPGIEIEKQLLTPQNIEIVDAPDGEEDTLARLAVDVDAIATCWARVTPKVVQAARNCRVICRMGIGLDNIAVHEATARGIPVTNIPDYCVEEVADHALALVLVLTRNVAFFHLRTKQQEYDLKQGPPIHRFRGQKLGVLGMGRTAQALIHRARAFGFDVQAHSPSMRDHGLPVRMVSLEELIETSDVLSLHAPLVKSSRHLLNAEAFARMKRGIVIVNTSRGGLIDEAALWNALQQGVVAGVGLDVFDPEPPDLSQPLFQDERVIVTPHTAFVSEESLVELRERVARQVIAISQGKKPENVRNPEVLRT